MVITVAVAVVAVSGVGRCGQKVTRWRTVRNQRTEESSYHFQKWLKNDLPAQDEIDYAHDGCLMVLVYITQRD
uniref:Putative secreted protein n=1 Tax=Anopheles triannulatus TaxID=58253 RepID=A0A2M4B2M0_9DIPT